MIESKKPTDADEARPINPKRVVLYTFGVVLAAWLILFLMTEDVGLAPFVYAIF